MTRPADNETVSVSMKGQLVIPKRLRSQVGLEAGGVVRVGVSGKRIFLEPVAPEEGSWRAWRGVLAGTDALAEHVQEHEEETARERSRS